MSLRTRTHETVSDGTEYTYHVEPPTQGGKQYVRCEGCERELLVCLGGADRLTHADGCPNVTEDY